MGLREDIKEDTRETVATYSSAYRNVICDKIARHDQETKEQLDRIEAKLGGEPAKIQLRDLGKWLAHIRNHEMIHAIREVRQLTGCGLKEAKDFCEQWRENLKVAQREEPF